MQLRGAAVRLDVDTTSPPALRSVGVTLQSAPSVYPKLPVYPELGNGPGDDCPSHVIRHCSTRWPSLHVTRARAAVAVVTVTVTETVTVMVAVTVTETVTVTVTNSDGDGDDDDDDDTDGDGDDDGDGAGDCAPT